MTPWLAAYAKPRRDSWSATSQRSLSVAASQFALRVHPFIRACVRSSCVRSHRRGLLSGFRWDGPLLCCKDNFGSAPLQLGEGTYNLTLVLRA